MNSKLRQFGILVVVAAVAAWLLISVRAAVRSYLRLLRAKRLADQFYAECPSSRITKNVVYDPSVAARLDVYRPESGSGHPVAVYVYGGSWNSGNKELYASAARRLLPAGLVLVIPDYTLYPAAGYPRQTQDIAAAIAWTLDNIGHYGGDPRRVVVAAQSAGAQVAALVVLDPRWLAAHQHSPSELKGFIGISGVYDLPTQLEHLHRNRRASQFVMDVFGGSANLRQASPSQFVSAATPPTLLIHGDADRTVPVRMSRDYHRRLLAAGVQSDLLIYRRAGHAEILLKALTDDPSQLINDILNFIRPLTESADGATRAAPSSAETA
jgi:acetyl esterase/lipase